MLLNTCHKIHICLSFIWLELKPFESHQFTCWLSAQIVFTLVGLVVLSFLSLNLSCEHVVRSYFTVTASCPFPFPIITISSLPCPIDAQMWSITAFVYVLSTQDCSTLLPLLSVLLCVRSCSVYLSIYLSVCLPVSMSLCICLASLSVCLSVCTSGCLPLSVSSSLCSPGFCGTPRDECSFPTRFQMWCSARMTAASQPTSLCSSPAATGWLPCSAAPSWRATLRR